MVSLRCPLPSGFMTQTVPQYPLLGGSRRKAIFDWPVAAEKGRASGERRGRRLGLRAPSEQREERATDERDEGHDRRASASATALLSPRLLDQRLDEGFDLFAVERLAVASLRRLRGRTRRGGNSHACLHSNIELVLLVH